MWLWGWRKGTSEGRWAGENSEVNTVSYNSVYEAHYFVGCCSFISLVIKHPDQGGEANLAHNSSLLSIIAAKSQRQELQTAGHVTSAVQDRGVHACCQLASAQPAFFTLRQARVQSIKWCHPHPAWVLPPQLTMTAIPYRHTHVPSWFKEFLN